MLFEAVVSAVLAVTAPVTYTEYATRIGLVGNQTANGHTVADRDHFVALPSRRSLSPKGTGDFSVRVCSPGTGRCAYEPVWDVGPWNTHDDYWSTGREQWADLPRGTAEAYAAYYDGYNGGQDEFGRTVTNPAAIDLADGTFWDGLGLTGNGFVTVTFLWTGTGLSGTVATGGGPLRVRAGASTATDEVGLAGEYARVTVECQAVGERIAGAVGTSDQWDRIGPGNYVSHAYVRPDPGASYPPCV